MHLFKLNGNVENGTPLIISTKPLDGNTTPDIVRESRNRSHLVRRSMVVDPVTPLEVDSITELKNLRRQRQK